MKVSFHRQILECMDGFLKNSRLSQISVIAAISSFGEVFYTINFGKNNSETFSLFLFKLIQFLDHQNPNWRQNPIIIIDNASYHKSKKMFDFYKNFKIPIIFLGPYHFRMAPVEMLFAYIKSQDINKLKSRAENKYRNQIRTLVEIAVYLSTINTSWIQNSFIHVLTAALDSLSLRDL